MKHIGKILLIILLVGIGGCNKVDFSDIAQENPNEENYTTPHSISMPVDKDSMLTISGVDSCFLQITSGEDIIDIEPLYVVGDRSFFGGITTLLRIHSLKEGVAICRLYNRKYNYDTTVYIQVTGKYVFSPYLFTFPISQKSAIVTVTGPKELESQIMNTFIVERESTNHTANEDGNVREDKYNFKYVGSTFLRYYNEDIDTLIRIEITPTYNVYRNLPLDFDDTRDSVVNKLYSVHYLSIGDEKYVVNDPYNDYELQIVYNNNGKIDHYTVDFQSNNITIHLGTQSNVSSDELRGFIEERYSGIGITNTYVRYSKTENDTSTSHSPEIVVVLDVNKRTLKYSHYVQSN